MKLGDVSMQALMWVIPLILALCVHEYAHALVASRLGDRTAALAGRLSLNPLVHLDPFGSLMLPFMLLLFNGALGQGMVPPFFAYARPTPVQARNFVRGISVRRGSFYVAAAGPAANLLFAALCAALFIALLRGLPERVGPAGALLLLRLVEINLCIAGFNLLPLRPLDGLTMLTAVLPTRASLRLEALSARFGLLGMLAAMFFAGPLLLEPVSRLDHMLLQLAQ